MGAEAAAATVRAARQWAEHDPDPATRAAVLDWIACDDQESLQRAFAGPLAFGTAGLRAAVGPGESQLNRAVVLRTTAGLMAWLNEQVDCPVVVIGCDARHGSAEFYRDAARAVAGAGGRALVLPPQNPTPLTAFTVRELGADAGIMVTASHNPPADNGYKVYLGGRIATGNAAGVQLISPADKEIAAAISAAPFADEVPTATAGIENVDTRDAYVARVLERAAEITGRADSAQADPQVTVALTAMHGVGAALAERALTQAGVRVSLVPEQAEPDGDFPTVSFPNPEEDGALDLAKAHASKVGADVIIALDPDADRCAVAVPGSLPNRERTQEETGWRQLTGDETGAIVGEFIASRHASRHVGTAEGVLASSVVSSRVLGQIAAGHGLEHRTTLTGFKWIARTPGLVYGYEEALGLCCDPQAVADKDGISAAVIVAGLVRELKERGEKLADFLAGIATRYGLYQTRPLTFRVTDTAVIAKHMRTLRETPPTSFAGSPVVETRDLLADELGIGPTDGMVFVTANNDRVICRPSGTEPKLKCYLEVVLPVADGQVPRDEAAARLGTIADELQSFLGA